ncbi:hypothetical protein HDU98_001932 [Podochytrium sp. JEL0797]|nr:hypothetical protein HDU98_001932 [Podochytrium sp. JEL0797]
MSAESPLLPNQRRFPARHSSSFLSQWSFSYVREAIERGRERPLITDDWAPLDFADEAALLSSRLSKAWSHEKHFGTSLAWTTIKLNRWSIVAVLAATGVEESLNILIAFCLGLLLTWFEKDSNTRDVNQALTYCFELAVIGLAGAVIRHVTRWLNAKLGLDVRIAFTGSIYRKCMNLPISHASSGHAVGLIATDVDRFEQAAAFFAYVVIAPLVLVIVTGMMYWQIGPAAFVASFVTLLIIPAQAHLSDLFAKYRNACVKPRDNRLQFVSDMIQGVFVMKMNCWEEPLIEHVDTFREEEVSQMRNAAVLKAVNLSIYQMLSCIVELFTFGFFFCLSGGILSPTKVFTTVALLQTLKWNMGLHFPLAVQFCAESLVSFRRIQNFLSLPEIETPSIEYAPAGAEESTLVFLKSCSFTWPNELPSHPTLHEIDLVVNKGQMIVVFGPVGAGKSSLLNGILHELHSSGTFYSRPGLRISYACQTPWIVSGTVQDNIVFGHVFDVQKLAAVIKACALERDLEMWTDGLQTKVGERGVSLSGGQKSRVGLARACYADADLVLMDDPLSAVDGKVGRQLVDDCVNGFLKDKARILVTHQTQYLRASDLVLLLENGRVVSFGPYASTKGGVGVVKNPSIGEGFDDAETFATAENEMAVDQDTSSIESLLNEDATEGVVSFSVYRDFFRSGSSSTWILILVLACLSSQCLLILTDWWIGQWSSQLPDAQQDSSWGIILLLLSTITLVTVMGRTLLFFELCLECSLKMSQTLVRSVFEAEMRFFVENPAGRILNRFSSDLNRVDEVLPFTMFDFINTSLSSIAALFLAMFFLPVVLTTVPVIAFVFWHLQTLYLTSSRQLKRQEAITRSPIFSTISVTLAGLSTLRAFHAEPRFINTLMDLQNENSKISILSLGLARWLGLRLDLVAAVFNIVVTFCAVGVGSAGGLSGASLGLVLTYSLNLVGVLQWAFRQSAETENLMTSVERVLEFCNIPPEPQPLSITTPHPPWPSCGEITIRNLSVKYPPSTKPVLKNISVHIPAGSTVAIVGRTGSGKSTLLQAIFRFVVPEGSVTIDGIDTAELDLKTLRSCVSSIPQDPFCFHGTLRFNLDPAGIYGDTELWNALASVQLSETIARLSGQLDASIDSLSIGQKQLVCLARALLKRSKIIAMDEPTSSIDHDTEELIAKLLRGKGGVFHGATMLTVAHRLNTIMDYDLVMVLDEGRLVEFGPPAKIAYFSRFRNE